MKAGKEVEVPYEADFWLPPGYETDMERCYPVIYVLQNMDLPRKRMAELFQKGQFTPFIVVHILGISEPLNRGEMGVWSDSMGPSGAIFRKDLTAWVEKHFRWVLGPKGRVGCSKAGGGAMHLGLNYPDLFSAVVSADGALKMYDAGGDDRTYYEKNKLRFLDVIERHGDRQRTSTNGEARRSKLCRGQRASFLTGRTDLPIQSSDSLWCAFLPIRPSEKGAFSLSGPGLRCPSGAENGAGGLAKSVSRARFCAELSWCPGSESPLRNEKSATFWAAFWMPFTSARWACGAAIWPAGFLFIPLSCASLNGQMDEFFPFRSRVGQAIGNSKRNAWETARTEHHEPTIKTKKKIVSDAKEPRLREFSPSIVAF